MAPPAYVRLDGAEAMRARLLYVAGAFPGEMAKALRAEMAIEMKESMRRTPVDTGALRASHVLLDPVVRPGEVSATIQVGGPAAPYAEAVHEGYADHKVGQRKFLESTLLESAPHMMERIHARLRLDLLLRPGGRE